MNNNKKLTPEEIEQLRGTKIPPEKRDLVIRSINKDKMHIDNRGVLRYKSGMNPKSLETIRKIGEKNRFVKGQSGFQGRKHLTKKALREIYQVMLQSHDKKDKKELAQKFAEMHIKAIKYSYKKKNLSLFRGLLTDFASISGDLEKDRDDEKPTVLQPVFILPNLNENSPKLVEDGTGNVEYIEAVSEDRKDEKDA